MKQRKTQKEKSHENHAKQVLLKFQIFHTQSHFPKILEFLVFPLAFS